MSAERYDPVRPSTLAVIVAAALEALVDIVAASASSFASHDASAVFVIQANLVMLLETVLV